LMSQQSSERLGQTPSSDFSGDKSLVVRYHTLGNWIPPHLVHPNFVRPAFSVIQVSQQFPSLPENLRHYQPW
jgi:hypothetical protein